MSGVPVWACGVLCGCWGACLSLWVTPWALECLSECWGAIWVLRHYVDMLGHHLGMEDTGWMLQGPFGCWGLSLQVTIWALGCPSGCRGAA